MVIIGGIKKKKKKGEEDVEKWDEQEALFLILFLRSSLLKTDLWYDIISQCVMQQEL